MYLAWEESNTLGSYVYVVRCQGGRCSRVGRLGNGIDSGSPTQSGIQPAGGLPDITNVDGVPYVMWTQCQSNGTTCSIQVARWTAASGWQGEGPVAAGSGVKGGGITAVDGEPWVLWSDTQATHVSQLSGGMWEEVGSPLAPSFGLQQDGITTAGGLPYVVIYDTPFTNTGSEMRVKTLMREMPFAVTGLRARPARGAVKLSFTLAGPATVRLDFTQPAGGREVGGNCVAPRASNAHEPACTRVLIRGTIVAHGHRGANTILVARRLSRHTKLRHGHYGMRLTATGPRRRASLPIWVRVTF